MLLPEQGCRRARGEAEAAFSPCPPHTCQAGSLRPGRAQQRQGKPCTPKSSRKPANPAKNPKSPHHLPLTSNTSLLGLLGRRSPADQGLDLGKCLKILRILFVTSPKQVAAPAFPSVILGRGGQELSRHVPTPNALGYSRHRSKLCLLPREAFSPTEIKP